MKYVKIKLNRPIEVPVEVIGSAWFGLLLKVKPSSAQSEVYGRHEWWVGFWKVKS